MGGYECDGDDEAEKEADLERDEYKEEELDDEQKLAMKELKKMDGRRWKKILKPSFEQFNLKRDLRDVNLKVGQIFADAKVFKEAAREHAIKQGRTIWFPCNEKTRVQGVCKGSKGESKKCPWSVWASQ